MLVYSWRAMCFFIHCHKCIHWRTILEKHRHRMLKWSLLELKTPSEGAMPSKPCQAGTMEGTGITLSATECHTKDHPALTQICRSTSPPRGHRRQRGRDLTGGKGRSSLTPEMTLQSRLSWAQHRKINHPSWSRGQGLLHDCLIRCKITPQAWLQEASRDQIQQHQTRQEQARPCSEWKQEGCKSQPPSPGPASPHPSASH